MHTPMTILRDKLIEEYQKLQGEDPDKHARGYMEALKNIASDIDDNMLVEERKRFIGFGELCRIRENEELFSDTKCRSTESLFTKTYNNEP